MNTVMLMGRLTRDPESRATQSGTAVVRFSLAVNRPKRKDKKQDADFINCVAFGRTAEVIQQYVFKGNRLLVEGEIRTSSYVDKTGHKRYTTEVMVNHIEFIEPREGNGTHTAPSQNGGFDAMGYDAPADEEIPF